MVECDRCRKGFHASCLNPPLSNIPKESWFCSKCAVKCVDADSSPSRWGEKVNGARLMKEHITQGGSGNYIGFIDLNGIILRHGNDFPSLERTLQRSLTVFEAIETISHVIQLQADSRGCESGIAAFDSDSLDSSASGSVPYKFASRNSDEKMCYWSPVALSREGTYLNIITVLLLIFQTCREFILPSHCLAACCFRQNVWKTLKHTVHYMHSELDFYIYHGRIEACVAPCDDYQEKAVKLAGIALAHLLLNECLPICVERKHDSEASVAVSHHAPSVRRKPHGRSHLRSRTSPRKDPKEECSSKTGWFSSARPSDAKSDTTTLRKRKKTMTSDPLTLMKPLSSDSVQLFADHFMSDGIAQNESVDGGRPKRSLKVVPRFQPTFGGTQSRVNLKVGSGFVCPRCEEACSYDMKSCPWCGLLCQYCAGVGVVVCKDRDDASTPQLMDAGFAFHLTKYKKKEPTLQKTPISEIEGKKAVNNKPTVECEVCLKLFVNILLHRKRCHGLQREGVGCPFCDEKFNSWKSRNDHVVGNHLKAQVSNNTDRQSLVQNERPDNIDSDDGIDKQVILTDGTQCPLCSFSNKWSSTSELMQHFDEAHAHHRLKNPKDGSFSRYELVKSQQEERVSFTATRLNIPHRNDGSILVFDDNDPRPISDILADIEDKLKLLQARIQEIASESQNMDQAYKKYNAEMKLFAKHLRERNLEMEREKHESSNYAEEERLRLIRESYDKRNRKRTKADIMLDKFCTTPIVFARTRKAKSRTTDALRSKGQCQIDGCYLCKGDFAKVLLTDEEIQFAGGDFRKAIPVVNNAVQIPNPAFTKLSSSVDDDEDEDDDSTEGGNNSEDSKMLNEWVRLNKMKSQARFIERYNKSLLSPMKESSRMAKAMVSFGED